MRDVVDFIHRHYQTVNLYGNPTTDYAVQCHSCDDSKTHLHVNIFKEVCHCFRCDYSNSWIGLVMDVTGYDYARALGELYTVPKPDLELLPGMMAGVESTLPRMRSNEFIFPDGYIPIYGKAESDSQAIPVAKRYLRSRGFGPWYWKRYQLGVHDYRILIPIEGDFWQSRAIFSFSKPRYMSPSDESLDVLFNSDALSLYDEVVICEGAFSAMAVGENAIALVGKNPTSEKIRRLLDSDVTSYIIVVESKAEKTMIRLADALNSDGRNVIMWIYNEDEDPADWIDPKQKQYDLRTKMELLLK